MCATLFDADGNTGNIRVLHDGSEESDTSYFGIRSLNVYPGCTLDVWQNVGFSGITDQYETAASATSETAFELNGMGSRPTMDGRIKSYSCTCQSKNLYELKFRFFRLDFVFCVVIWMFRIENYSLRFLKISFFTDLTG